PITSQPKERYNRKKRLSPLRPTTAWGRPSSGASNPGMTSSVQDLRRAIEEAESRRMPANLESAVKKQVSVWPCKDTNACWPCAIFYPF
ncbi:hypothetical protein DUNSADRAFT_2970, partial [Dunaliella salina]